MGWLMLTSWYRSSTLTPIMKLSLITKAAILAIAACSSSYAFNVGFTQITTNTNTLVANQFNAEVTNAGTGFAIKFTNAVGIASNISEIYSTSAKTLGAMTITESGADFSAGGTPASLPGGSGFSIRASANNPAPSNGINAAGDFVTLTFLYGGSFANFTAVENSFNDGSMQLGMHVTGIAGITSDSFTSRPPGGGNIPGTPDSGSSIALLGLGLALLAVARRKLA